MIDNDRDWLGLEDEEEKQRREPAMLISAQRGPHELLLLERIHRTETFGVSPITALEFRDPTSGKLTRTEQRDTNRVLFIDVDEETGEERWATDTRRGVEIREGRRWARILGWSDDTREPTIEEAQAFCAHHRARIFEKHREALAAAAALDRAEGFAPS